MKQYFFFHNLDTCVGCCACQTACKDHNNLPPGSFFRRVVEVETENGVRFFSASCGHCEKPACLEVCPNQAYEKLPDGTVIHHPGRCIGCGKCVWSCPYGAISLSTEKGVAQKCNGCVSRRTAGLEPACVAACVNGSLQLEKTDGRCPPEEVSDTIPGVLPDPSLTKPRFRVYLGRGGQK